MKKLTGKRKHSRKAEHPFHNPDLQHILYERIWTVDRASRLPTDKRIRKPLITTTSSSPRHPLLDHVGANILSLSEFIPSARKHTNTQPHMLVEFTSSVFTGTGSVCVDIHPSGKSFRFHSVWTGAVRFRNGGKYAARRRRSISAVPAGPLECD